MPVRLQWGMHGLTIFIQILLTIIEIIQMHGEGLRGYFSDGWNWVDIGQAITFTLRLIFHSIKYKKNKDPQFIVFVVLIENLLMLLMFFKAWYFMRMYKSFAIIL